MNDLGMAQADSSMIPLRVAVITVSDTRDLSTDKSGDALVSFVESAGHTLFERKIIKDELDEIRLNVARLCKDTDAEVVLITGGTGITERDVTPEAIAPLVDKEILGFGELFRMLSYEDIGAATIQSRATAALCSKTLVFALPGSTGAVRLAIDKILRSQLDSRTKPCNFATLIPRL
jgi:molybdenum cofactor biosynthesis protein B